MDLIKMPVLKRIQKKRPKPPPPPSIKTFALYLWKCFAFLYLYCMCVFLEFVCYLPENEGKNLKTSHYENDGRVYVLRVFFCFGICMIEIE